ncbi:MAG: hypothetical protein HYT61_02090 [Candidatus Yanofskybacteria bacterium]|nr:hypothetical protein [Candidatus Yanofskybacteria bacterium]
MWKSDPWRLYHIGDFFTDLALKILGGEKTASSQDSGDINNWDFDSQIEVKGCSNRNTLKIYSKQLDEEVEQLGFPFSHLLYVIFFYRNRWSDRSRSLSKETPNYKTLNAFLSKNIMVAFVIDARVLMAIRRVNGLRMEQRNNDVVHVIRISKGILHNFVKDSKGTLKHFKLRGFGVFSHKIYGEFRGSLTNFDLVFILSKKQLKKILQFDIHFDSEDIEIAGTQ